MNNKYKNSIEDFHSIVDEMVLDPRNNDAVVNLADLIFTNFPNSPYASIEIAYLLGYEEAMKQKKVGA